MDKFVEITVLVSGLYLLIMGLIQNTKNVQSAVIFKVIPVLTGMALIVSWLFLNGWLISVQ